MEVRSAVLNLRSVGGETQTLEEAIADMASTLLFLMPHLPSSSTQSWLLRQRSIPARIAA